jgi:ribulose-bisphosphate carboxylase small chain
LYLRHGTFSYLPELTDDEIAAQVRYALGNAWPVSVEYTDDPHPRNVYWEMWGLPMFDLTEPDGVLREINDCRAAFPRHYVRVLAYDARLGRQTTAMSFLVQRPAAEPGFRLDRTESAGRVQRYSVHSYATQPPPGARYGPGRRANGQGQGDERF